MKSIMQTDKGSCYLCGRNKYAELYGLDEHHIFGGADRKKSEKYGLKVFLCHDRCHENGESSVHRNREVSDKLRAEAQRAAMDRYGWSREDFIDVFGKNYI